MTKPAVTSAISNALHVSEPSTAHLRIVGAPIERPTETSPKPAKAPAADRSEMEFDLDDMWDNVPV